MLFGERFSVKLSLGHSSAAAVRDPDVGSVKSYAHRRTAHREGALMRAIRSAQLGDIIAELVFTQMLFPSNATHESPEPTA